MTLQLSEALQARGHSVYPVLGDEGCGWLEDEFQERGIQFERAHHNAQFDPVCLSKIVALMKRRSIDVVHSHEFVMTVYGAAATLLHRVPQVITLHGSRYHEGTRRRHAALRWACRRSAYTGTVSSATRDMYAESLDFPPASISVIPNGVRPQIGDGSVVRAELGLDDRESLILAVGNLYPVKGHSVLVQALTQLHRTAPDLPWRLAVAGRGDEEERLSTLTHEGGISDRVHLLGFRSDVADLLAAAQLFVMPSLSEGLPLALLEAMFAGKAIVASDVGGIPELIRDKQEGLLVPPRDPLALGQAVEKLLGDSHIRQELGEAARQRARSHYTIEAMTDAYEAVYGEAVARGRRRE